MVSVYSSPIILLPAVYYLSEWIDWVLHLDTYYSHLYIDLVVGWTLLLAIFLDISFTIVFLIGGHKKNVKLVRVFYVYSIVALCMCALTLATFAVQLCYYGPYDRVGFSFLFWIGLYDWSLLMTVLVITAIQAYVVLLLRSEISNLINKVNFNSDNEVKCIMENGTDVLNNGSKKQKNGTNDRTGEIDAHIKDADHYSFDYKKLDNMIPV